MNGRHHTDAAKEAAVADYRATGDPYRVVAARHGVSRSILHSWVNPDGVPPRKKTWDVDEIALTGGRWVVDRGVQRWVRLLHARYFQGCRESRTVVGERVYQRRQKRAQRARREAA